MGNKFKAPGVESSLSVITDIASMSGGCAVLVETEIIKNPVLMGITDIGDTFGNLDSQSIRVIKHILGSLSQVIVVPVNGGDYEDALDKIDNDDFQYSILLCPDITVKVDGVANFGGIVINNGVVDEETVTVSTVMALGNTFELNEDNKFADIAKCATFCYNRIKTGCLWSPVIEYSVSDYEEKVSAFLVARANYLEDPTNSSKKDAMVAVIAEGIFSLMADSDKDGFAKESRGEIYGKLGDKDAMAFLSISTWKNFELGGGRKLSNVAGIVRLYFENLDKVGYPLPLLGLSRGVMHGVELEGGKSDIDDLYSVNINPIIMYRGLGPIMWGNKTGLVLEEGIKNDMQYLSTIFLLGYIQTFCEDVSFRVIGEVLDTRGHLWDRWKAPVEKRLSELASSGALESFEVVMDSSNNTADERSKAELHAYVGITVSKGAERIFLKFNVGVSVDA